MTAPSSPKCRCGHVKGSHLEGFDMCLNKGCRCQHYLPPGTTVSRKTGRVRRAAKRRR